MQQKCLVPTIEAWGRVSFLLVKYNLCGLINVAKLKNKQKQLNLSIKLGLNQL